MTGAVCGRCGRAVNLRGREQICSNCHNQYRVRLDDGSYRYKDALPK